MATGAITFLLWAGLSGCCFLLATVLARLICPPPKESYYVRLVLMFFMVIVWWFSLAMMARAYIGNGADPTDPERRARWPRVGPRMRFRWQSTPGGACAQPCLQGTTTIAGHAKS
jgi:hypothetical protein